MGFFKRFFFIWLHRLLSCTSHDFYGIPTPTLMPYERFFLGMGLVFKETEILASSAGTGETSSPYANEDAKPQPSAPMGLVAHCG